MLLTVVLSICIGVIFAFYADDIMKGVTTVDVLLAVLVVALLLVLIFIYKQPTSGKKLTFSVSPVDMGL